MGGEFVKMCSPHHHWTSGAISKFVSTWLGKPPDPVVPLQRSWIGDWSVSRRGNQWIGTMTGLLAWCYQCSMMVWEGADSLKYTSPVEMYYYSMSTPQKGIDKPCLTSTFGAVVPQHGLDVGHVASKNSQDVFDMCFKFLKQNRIESSNWETPLFTTVISGQAGQPPQEGFKVCQRQPPADFLRTWRGCR